MKSYYLSVSILVFICCISQGRAQTVGNGSAIAPSAGQLGNYGINAAPTTGTQSTFRTRHYRRGNNSGIGNSFLGTTSPTSESSPATNPVSVPTAAQSTTQVRLPKLESAFSESTPNPAFESFTPALPHLPGSSSALSSPVTSAKTFGTQSDSAALENLPSFNKQPSLTDKMQFGSFDSSNKLGF